MITAPARTAVELLRFQPQSPRTALVFAALLRASDGAGVHVTETQAYRGRADWLLVWGPGAPNRVEAMRQQLAAGGHVLAIDGSYWDRDRKVRISIDAAHPQDWVMTRDWPTDRLKADRVPIANVWNPDGPVLVAGISDKARVQYGDAVAIWEAEMMQEAKARGFAVTYRPKRQGPTPAGVVCTPTGGPIDPALRGVSLVITWHSNVAVDAIRMGIPVLCRDGAAAAVCPSTWPTVGRPQPLTRPLRDRFLANLAWFQWGSTPSEAKGCWQFIQGLLA